MREDNLHSCKLTDFKPVYNSPGLFRCYICGRELNNPSLLEILNCKYTPNKYKNITSD